VSLRSALTKGGDDAWKIGLINALGQKQDAEAVSLIAAELKNPTTVLAAAQALGRIANPDAVEALWSAVNPKNTAAANGLVEAANRLLAKGNPAECENNLPKIV